MNEFRLKFEEKLKRTLSSENIGETVPLCEAMRYAVFSGGKRLRPMCVKLGAEFALGRALSENELELVLSLGVAIELVHSYSLVHDDLPSMDNDDVRRGMPTVHKKYGEDTAILAGDALLNLAFEQLFALIETQKSSESVRASKIIAKNAGILGMVKGQCLDLSGRFDSLEQLLEANRFKTGCLFKAAFLSGAVAVGATEKELAALNEYAENLGAAFQIVDDLLDADTEENSVVKFVGHEKAKSLAKDFTESAISAISSFGNKNSDLKNFAHELFGRTK